MQITCIGADPAALYLGVLLKRDDPAHAVQFIEGPEPAAEPVSAGLVCNPLKPRLELRDAEVAKALNAELARFDRLVVNAGGEEFAAGGFTHAALDRVRVAEGLKRLARDLGCVFEQRSAPIDPDEFRNADLIVIADGAASATRGLGGRFQVTLGKSATRFIVFELKRRTDALAYAFRATPGGIFHALSYPRGVDGSILIVEAPAEAIAASGLDRASARENLVFCQDLFPELFEGETPDVPAAAWRPFVTVQSRNWLAGNMILLGAAACTAHFSVGLDLRSSLEDAEALARHLSASPVPAEALAAYEADRRPKADSLQRAAQASATWFAHVDRYIAKPFEQFVLSLLTGSMRINYPRIAKAAPELVRKVDALIAGLPAGSNQPAPPPMFTPYRLRDLVLPNRIVVSPMCMYSAREGTVNDFHLVHLGSRAVGGAGLVITEMTDVLPEGRISLHCAGMYQPDHVPAWRRVVDFVHSHSNAKIGVQLAHAGRKGSLTRSWEGHENLGVANWEIVAPSPIAFAKGRQVPREMTRADMDEVRDAFVRATEMSEAAGFDMIELHYAHGYLMSSFISPLSNRRQDEYGGSLANRLRFPLEVFAAVRAAWPAHKPISTRISSVDWVEGGTTLDDAVEIGRLLHRAGNDILAVSTGGVVSEQRPVDGRLFQATFSDQIRNELDIPTMAVGGIVSHSDVNTVIAAGRADLCAMARGYLVDPYFVRHSAYAQDYDGLKWPSQYRRAREVRVRGE